MREAHKKAECSRSRGPCSMLGEVATKRIAVGGLAKSSDLGIDEVAKPGSCASSVRQHEGGGKAAPHEDAFPFSPQTLSVIILWLCSFLARVYRIERGGFVLWDEAHFGKFASYYMRGEYFFDVHPPLGKLLTALGAYLANIPRSFEFGSGEKYPPGVEYASMRVFHAGFGSLVPLFAFATLRSLEFPLHNAFVFSMLLVTENSMVAVSRLILLDPFLLFFISLTALFFSRILADNRKLHRCTWDLFCLGLSIGCVASIKWVGCLTVLHVGLFVLFALYKELAGHNPLSAFFRLFLRLFLFLALVPLAVYTLSFVAHFHILQRSGPGDGEMSSRFQASLLGTDISLNSPHLKYGNTVTIRSGVRGAGLLHSHLDVYPQSKKQQVTTYNHKDGNNHWVLLLVTSEGRGDVSQVHDGDRISLMHSSTRMYLSVDRTTSFLKSDGLVSFAAPMIGEGEGEGVGVIVPPEAVFKLETVGGDARLQPIGTHFMLKNEVHGCYLLSSGKTLPSWGFSQGEVLCGKKEEGRVWNIEFNKGGAVEEEAAEDPLMRRKSSEGRAAGLATLAWKEVKRHAKDILELNLVMNRVNNSLTNDDDLEPVLISSRPSEWAYPVKWLKISAWDGSALRFAIMGNPVTWIFSTLFIGLAPMFFLFSRAQRIRSEKQGEEQTRSPQQRGAEASAGCAPADGAASQQIISLHSAEFYLFFVGWALHYFPFFCVKRILYLHHYIPALFFAVLSMASLAKRVGQRVLLAFLCICCASFLFFSPLTYGHHGEAAALRGRNWIRSWNLVGEAEH